jgi:LytS/YehU family sensor histidine kinase
VTYLTDFAKLIRHVLQNSAHALIPLSAELQALDLYIRIERMRFDATFDYQINVAEDISPDSMRIPPLLLQPYVENAIWHGLMHKNDGHGMLKVTVSREGKDVYYVVEDNGIGREAAKLIRSKSAEKNKSMGMQITRDRMDISGKMSDTTFHVDIQDLYDVRGVPSGTRVILRMSPKH